MKNNKDLFMREYLCESTIFSKEYNKAYELWLYYHYMCEKYDQKICLRRDEYGYAFPTTNKERNLINVNASHVREDILRLKKEWEMENNTVIPDEDWQTAKMAFRKFTFKGLKKEFELISENK